jgi:hypothetical protein
MLALWEFFWNPADWAGSSTPPISKQDGGSRSSKKPPPSWKVDPWLERTSHDQQYWDLRERYLRRFLAPVLAEEGATPPQIRESSPIKAHEDHISEGQNHLRMLQQARDAVVQRARFASTQGELRKETARAIKLTLDIQSLRIQYYERAAIILLLDLF